MEEQISIRELVRMMGSKIQSLAESLSEENTQQFLTEICNARRIYVTGAGRSGLVAKAFAMRLMHLGLNVYVVGETIAPALKAGDTMVVFSGSGETRLIAEYAENAKKYGARICLITAFPESRIGRIADVVVEIESMRREDESTTFEVRQIVGKHKSFALPFAPLGTLFETGALVFSDAVISAIMGLKKYDIAEMEDRLANIQ